MSINHLHDDLLFYLKKFAHARDYLSLALSGANERASILLGTNRKGMLSIRECYLLRNKPWESFFKQYIVPSSIKVFDVSHCYWLEAKVICCCITKMENLEELSIQDTKMSLKKMPLVFEACKKVVKLSMTLKEDNLDEFKEGVMENASLQYLKNGFSKLTRLELFAFVVPSGDITKSWLVPLGVLMWCEHCVDLLINITYKDAVTDFCSQVSAATNEVEFNINSKEELLPRLTWMRKLKSLAILLGSHSQQGVKDDSTRVFIIDWLSQMRLEYLDRLWTFPSIKPDQDPDDYLLMREMRGPTVKSGLTDVDDWIHYDLSEGLKDGKYRQLEHLANIFFDYIENDIDYLSDLKYVGGICSHDTEALNHFCEMHFKLEELRFHLKNDFEWLQHRFELGDWKLPLLKVLVYSCYTLSQSVMDHLVEGCPNLEELHIEFSSCISRIETVDLFSTIQFRNLKWLTINGSGLCNGSYLLSIVKNCPKLERLHLNGSLADTFFLHLTKCFPFASNLRDLRIQCPKLQKYLLALPDLLKALKLCPYFERLALVADADDWKRSHIRCTSLQKSILPFVKETPHLVALCLVGFPIDPVVVQQQLIKEIVIDRPAFWFYLGPKLPKASDVSIPRIHYEGIVHPNDPFFAPPRF